MNRSLIVAVYVVVALLSGYGAFQGALGVRNVWVNYSFLDRARLADEYRVSQERQKQAAAAAKAAAKPTEAIVTP